MSSNSFFGADNMDIQQHAKDQDLKKTGTTTVGVVAKDAVILAADQKATMGYLVSNKRMKKVQQVDDHIGMTIAGLVGDADFLVKLMRAELKIYKLQRGPIMVKSAASLLANILYGGKGYWYYMVQLLLGGYDQKGPHLYSLDAAGGTTEEKDFFSTGSGSPMALGVLEDGYKENMGREEAMKLAVRAVKAATKRDAASGGELITAIIISKDGYHEVSAEEVRKIIGSHVLTQ